MQLLERVDGGLALEHGLRELAIRGLDVAQNGIFQILTDVEALAQQELFDQAAEMLDHSVGLRQQRSAKAVLDVAIHVEAVRIMIAGRSALAQAGR